MATLSIKKPDGTQGGSLDLNDEVFGIEPNVHVVRAVVAQYLNNQRAGTHKTKTRAEVSGGGKKPWKQKGTGRARQGSIRSPQWRHGAIIFGPRPRDYSQSVNKKVKAAAFCSVWSDLVRTGKLIVVDSFGLGTPRTKQFAQTLEALGVDGRALVVTAQSDDTVILSARNIPWVTPVNADNINVYALLTHDWVVTTPEVLKRIEETYA